MVDWLCLQHIVSGPIDKSILQILWNEWQDTEKRIGAAEYNNCFSVEG